MADKAYKVRAAHCDHRVSEEEIYQTLRRITDPLTRSWEKIEKADRVVFKFNMMMPPERIVYFEGRRQELVDEAVCRGVLRLVKEHTTAELVATDTNSRMQGNEMGADFNFSHILKEFGVRFVDANRPPYTTYEVPGGGSMFDRYTLTSCFEGSEVVSVAKMKNHAFMGLTLCMKNLFGLPPITPPEGRTRTYFHHFIRLSNVLPDLGMITQPCLNVIDALTGQWGREWGGEGRVCDALIAGDQVTATDACGAHLMGHDPASDWPTHPFRRDRNHLLVAAQRGFGTVDLDEIDFESEVQPPVAEFGNYEQDTPEIAARVRETACEQGLVYRDRREEMVERYGGEYIYLQDGEPVWNGPDPAHIKSHREFASEKPGEALFLKYVDPDEVEGERFGVYEESLARLRA